MSFKAVQAKIAAKSGVPMKNAGAILAASSRDASEEAKEKNPKLRKVKGTPRRSIPRPPQQDEEQEMPSRKIRGGSKGGGLLGNALYGR